MSRLDSAIRRLTAQKLTLEAAAHHIADLEGPALELGLGNGRTFDHLRTILPNREIFIFDRQVAAHPDCVSDAAHLLLGDFLETLPQAVKRFGATCAFIHCDIGTGEKASSIALGQAIAPHLAKLTCPGAIVVSDQPLDIATWRDEPLPPGVAEGRIHLYRATG